MRSIDETQPAAVPAATLSGDESLHLPEFDEPPGDPVRLLASWLAAAKDSAREPMAVVLATVNPDLQPSSRVVLVKDLETNGSLLFTTHHDSRKGRDLAQHPRAAMTFYWRETLQQINVTGTVERVLDAEADELFAERPLAAQATTTVSRQGAHLDDEQALHDRARQLIDAGIPVPRPEGWGGYRLVIDTVEFWQGRNSRLHRRLAYLRTDCGWQHHRLQP